MKIFKSIKYWIFDLDNTLYSGKTKVFEQVDKKMSKYISKKLNVSIEEAKKIISDGKKMLDQDIEKKKKNFNIQIEKEIASVEKEIKDLKKNSLSNIGKIASETSAELIKNIINTEVNKSNVTAVVDEIIKRNKEKYI